MRGPDRVAILAGIAGWRRTAPGRWTILLAIHFSLAIGSSTAMAASDSWSATAGNGAWQTATNWLLGFVPGDTSGTTNADTATFNSSSSTSVIVPDPNRDLENITFDAAAGSYTIGATGGNSLLLTSGGTIQIASTLTGNHVTERINAPLVLEGNYTLADNCTNQGVLLNFGGAISTAGNTLTISGPGSISVTGNISGGASVSKTGTSTAYFTGDNSSSGGTTVTAGILVVNNTLGDLASPITISAAAGVNSALVLGANPQGQTVGSLAGTVAPSGSAVLSISGNDTLTVNQATNTTFGGTVLNSGTFIKSGAGTLEITGAATWSNLSSIELTAGKLRLNVASGSASVGSGVEATVMSGATLELAGSVSALSAGADRVNIMNDSAAPGLLVTGTNQVVGNIDGSGTTEVNAGSDLTANHIVQSALVIGGTSTNRGRLTIDASDAAGNPLAGVALPGMSSTLVAPFDVGSAAFNSVGNPKSGNSEVASSAPLDSRTTAEETAVPEPASLILLAIGGLAMAGAEIRRRPSTGARRRSQRPLAVG